MLGVNKAHCQGKINLRLFLGVFCYLILTLKFDSALLFYAFISFNLAKNLKFAYMVRHSFADLTSD